MEKPWKAEEHKYQTQCRNCGKTLLIPLSVLATGQQMVCSNCKHIIYVEGGSMIAATELSKRLKNDK